jgi:transcription elongation factor GreA
MRENAEYKAAKERQKFLEARIGQLHRRAAALSMANMDKIPRGKVGLGSTVSLRHTETQVEIVYEIVTPEESDPTVGRISPRSPIGKALLNPAEGDTVEIQPGLAIDCAGNELVLESEVRIPIAVHCAARVTTR